MIEFSPQIGFWSKFMFWYVLVNCLACLVFTIVIIVGGFFDLRYLLKALKEDSVNDFDDGRVITSGLESHVHSSENVKT